MRKRKILIFAESINRIGGAEKISRDIVESFIVLLGRKNVGVVSVYSMRDGYLRKIYIFTLLFLNILLFSPTYIFCNYLYLNSYVNIISSIFKIRSILYVHGVEMWNYMSQCQIKQIKNIARIITNSRFTADKLLEKGINPNKISIIHPRVDVNYYSKIKNYNEIKSSFGFQNKKIILTVGRMSSGERYKGHEELIRIFPDISREVNNAMLLIVGGGDDLNRLRDLAKKTHPGGNIIFTGKIDDDKLPLYYNICDVFVMYSRVVQKEDGRWGGEGFGIVFLEASSCGKPVIGAKSGGISDAVSDGYNGILVDPDNLESLKESIIKLLKDERYANWLGRNGREWVKKFDVKELPLLLKKMLDKLEEKKCVG